MAATKTVDLSRYRGLDIKSITVRSTDGQDVIDAANRCIAPGQDPIPGEMFGIMLKQQLVAGAIVDVDGKKTRGGVCLESIKWSTRTREYVGEIYDYLNGITMEEREDFRKTLAEGDLAPSPSTPETSSEG